MKPKEKHKFTPKEDPSYLFFSCFYFISNIYLKRSNTAVKDTPGELMSQAEPL